MARLAQRPRPLSAACAAALVALGSCASAGCSAVLLAVRAARDASAPRRTLALDETVRGDTRAGGDDRARASCRGDRAEPERTDEHAYRFVAPRAERVRFIARGDFDTVLAVLRDGEELACNDDNERGDGLDASLALRVEAGRAYTVVVDGFRGDRGRYELRAAAEAEPPPEAREPPRRRVEDPIVGLERCRSAAPLPLGLSAGAYQPGPGAMASCGGAGSGVVYRVRVAQPSRLVVREVSAWPAALELRRGCGPAREVLACAAHEPERGPEARIEALLEAGEYLLVLDSTTGRHRGPFALDARLEPQP